MLRSKKIMASCLIAIMAISMVFAGGSKEKEVSATGKPVLTIGTIFYGAEVPNRPDIEKELERLTGYEIEIMFIPSASYHEKVGTLVASDSLPMIILTDPKQPYMISGAQSDMFWQLDDYIADYPNLAAQNPAIYDNTRIDGKLYGLYRERSLIRCGIMFRQDWLDQLGLDVPINFVQLEEVMRGFMTLPGVDCGLVTSGKDGVPGALNTFAIWNGAPNKFGVDADGNIIPEFFHPKHFEMVKWFKRMYDEGLINRSFGEITNEECNRLINIEKAGIISDVTDNVKNRFVDLATINPDSEMNFSVIWEDSDQNKRAYAFAGYHSTFSISKTAVPDEETMRMCLDFLDKIKQPEVYNLYTWGFEGVDHTVVDGYAVKSQAQEDNWTTSGAGQYGSIQLYPKFPGVLEGKVPELWQRVDEEQGAKWAQYGIHNVCNPFSSEAWSLYGSELDLIKQDIICKFIMGVIDEDDYIAGCERWLAEGGQEVLDEYTAKYKAANK